jgi:hypothetical protein
MRREVEVIQREVDEGVKLFSPVFVLIGESLEVHHEDAWHLPHIKLLRGLPELLALVAVPRICAPHIA